MHPAKAKKQKKSRVLTNFSVARAFAKTAPQHIFLVSQLLGKAIQLNPQHATASVRFRAVSPGPPKCGVTFLPPLTLNPTIITKAPNKKHLLALSFMAGRQSAVTYFNWADAQNVSEVKGWKLRDSSLGPYTVPVQNQESCGSCYSVSSASVLSDRWAIWTQGPNPGLSATNILGCLSDGTSIPDPQLMMDLNNGCGGGLPSSVADLMYKYGIVDQSCIPYDWCSESALCNGTKQSNAADPVLELNSIVPRCNNVKSCITCSGGTCSPTGHTPQKIYKCGLYDNGLTSISLTNPEDIKNELVNNGPVVGCMHIFFDFMTGSCTDQWAATNNVYCNVQGSGLKPYANTLYAGTEASSEGYHAIVVVGFGTELNVPSWVNPGQKIALPYFLVRNSWSDSWNVGCTVNGGKVKMPGYFKIAISNDALNLNTQVLLDRAGPGGAIGGCTAFFPDVARVTPVPKGSSNQTNPTNPTNPTTPTTAETWSFANTNENGSGACVVNETGPYSSEEQCVAANHDVMSATCTGTTCKIVADGSGADGTYTNCLRTCASGQTIGCDWVSGQCTLNSSGKYVGLSVCPAECHSLHTRNWGLISGSIALVVLLAIVLMVIYIRRKKNT